MSDAYLHRGDSPLPVRRRSRQALLRASLLCILSGSALAADIDNDGIDDAVDNCIEAANANQRDTNGDGFGNVCDADLDNNGTVNVLDLGLLKKVYLTANADADLDGNGTVNVLDLGIMKRLFGKAPGPKGSGAAGIPPGDAARFLNQATFGPGLAEIQSLQSNGTYDAWLNEQFALGPSLLLPSARSMYDKNRAYCLTQKAASECPEDRAKIKDTYDDQFRIVWWDQVIDGPDQLRQRVAFALSQILVVGDFPEPIAGSRFALADYYDTLSRHAFGNYRELLEAVTLHPIMGIYLSMLRNEKADPERNIRPDENYAREILQLFSIGVDELNISGQPVLDANGQPKPAYDQAAVESFARVFTGWNLVGVEWWRWLGEADRTKPMVPVEQYHDTGEKKLLRGTVLPAGQTARQDLEAALDNIFQHPNVGPYISRLLILRLVTSNPSPTYVGRVAAVFNNNGQGVRGDLRAVVRAILLDSEARQLPANDARYGKLREPMLRLTHLLRAFDAKRITGKEWGVAPSVAVYRSPGPSWRGFRGLEQDIGQNILRSPSVFNFFLPTYSPAGVLKTAGLRAPEFQIATESTVMATVNAVNFHLNNAEPGGDWSYLNLAKEASLAADPDKLLDHLNVVLLSGRMPASLRAIVRQHLVESPFPANAEGNLAKARDAITLLVNAPEYLVQK